jgi:hypothetical protein
VSDSSEPLSAERLAEIRDTHRPHRMCDDCTYRRPCHARDLLAHMDHLTAERDAAVADAWDRGYTSGHSNAMRRMSDEPDAPTSPNPYRP